MIGFTFSWLEFWPKKNEGKRGGIRMEESIYNVTLRKHLKYLSSDLLLTQVHTKSQNGWCCRSREIGSWLRQTSSRRQLQIAVEEVPDPWSPRQDKGPEDFFRLDSARCRPIWYSSSPPPPTPFAEAKLSGYFNRGSLCFIWLGFQIHERGLRNTNSLGFTCIQFDFNELTWNGLNRTKVLTWI